MSNQSESHKDFFFISFGREQGGLLQFLNLPSTADAVAVKKAVKDYRKRLEEDLKTNRKPHRERMKDGEITEEEYNALAKELEQDKSDKLAEINRMNEGWERTEAQKRNRTNLADGEPITWFEIFPREDHSLWQQLLPDIKVFNTMGGNGDYKFERNHTIADINVIPTDNLIDTLFQPIGSTLTRVVEAIFDPFDLIENSTEHAPLSATALFETIIKEMRANLHEVDAIHHERLLELASQLEGELDNLEKGTFILHADDLQFNDDLATFMREIPLSIAFLIALTQAYRQRLMPRFEVIHANLVLANDTKLEQKNKENAFSLAHVASKKKRKSSEQAIESARTDVHVQRPIKLLMILKKINDIHQSALDLADELWAGVKYTNRAFWQEQIATWYEVATEFDRAWTHTPQSTSDPLPTRYRYTQYIDELSSNKLEDIPSTPIRFEDLPAHEQQAQQMQQAKPAQESTKRKRSIQDLLNAIKERRQRDSGSDEDKNEEDKARRLVSELLGALLEETNND